MVRERRAVGRSSPATTDSCESYSLAQLEDDFTLLGGVLLVVQACFAVTDVFKGWGNNKRNLVPWMVRLCRFTQRIDVSRLCALLAARRPAGQQPAAEIAKIAEIAETTEDDVRAVLLGMQQKATEALERLRAEHGDVDAL